MNDRFEIPARLRNTSLALIGAGILTVILGVVLLLGGNEHDKTRFWVTLLHDGIFFTLIATASVFIQAASTLAQGSWLVAYRRIPEAIGANVWVFGAITAVIMFLIIFVFNIDGTNPIYTWVHPGSDKILQAKTPFLNPSAFVISTIVTIGLWAFFGYKFRAWSIAQESAPKNDPKIYWKNFRWSGVFIVVYALTQMSITPWMWIMSVQAHWQSTLFSWYTFASAFVCGMAVILLWVVYLKNQGNLQLVSKEHIHDLGKLMFAFSIFWTYLWFAQYLLTWYANIPEETVHFKLRQQGPYSIIFYANFIINFCMPILILMSRPSKRNYFTVVFMALIIVFGHWLDFYQMIIPGPMGEFWKINWYEIGIFAGFAGVMIFCVSRTLAKASLIPNNNIFLKEAIIHIS